MASGTYLTGRTRTLEMGGTFSGNARINLANPVMGQDPKPYANPILIADSAIGAVEAKYFSTVGSVGIQLAVSTLAQSYGTTGNVYLIVPGDNPDWTANMGGTYRVTAQLEECWIVAEELSPPTGENLTTRRVQVVWRTPIGGTMTYAASCGSAALSGSGTANSNIYIEPEEFTLLLSAQFGGSGGCGVSGTFMNASLPIARTYTGAKAQIIAAANAVSLSCGYESEFQTFGTARVSSEFAPTKQINLHAQCRTPGGPFPSPVGYEATLVGPADPGSELHWTAYDSAIDSQGRNMLAASAAQRFYQLSGNLDGSAIAAESLDERMPVNVRLRNGWLSGQGESATNDRVMLLGRPFDAMTLAHAGTYVVDAGGTAAWSDVANTTIADAGGSAVSIAVAGGVGQTLWTAGTANQFWNSYRYLEIVWRADQDSQSMRLRVPQDNANRPSGLTEKYWDLAGTAADAWITSRIDLCYPQNIAVSTDDNDWYDDDRPPPASPTLEIDDDDGQMWGVDMAPQFRLENLADTVTYEVEEVRLIRRDHTRVSFIPAFNHGLFLHGMTDWRQSLEVPALQGARIGTATTDTSGVLYSIMRTTGNLQFRGWTAAEGGSADAYHNLLLDAECLYGGGIAFDDDWLIGVDVNCGTTVTVKAQSLFDQIDLPPESGDLFYQTDGAVGGATTLRAKKFLRSQAYGIVYDTAGNPLNGVPVTLQDQAGQLEGIGYTDQYGGYKTETPWAKGAGIHRAVADFGDSRGTVTYGVGLPTWYGAKRHRACFRQANATGDWIDRDLSRSGRHARAHLLGGTIQLGFASDSDGRTWTDLATTLAGTQPMIRYRRDRSSQLWLAYVNGGTLLTRYTENEGGTFSVADTISGTALFHDFALSPQGRYHYYLAGGTIFCKALDWAGGTLIGGTAVQTGVDTNAIAVRDYETRNGVWNVGLTYRASGNLISKSSIDGVTFT